MCHENRGESSTEKQTIRATFFKSGTFLQNFYEMTEVGLRLSCNFDFSMPMGVAG